MAVYKINESNKRLKESDVNFFKKKRTRDKYSVYVYNKNDLASRDLLDIVRKYGLSYEFPQYHQPWMSTPSDIILIFKSQDLDKAAQAFSEINDNYTPDEVKEIARAQGVVGQVQESSDDSTFQYLRRNYLQAKKDFETKGEKDNNDVLSREDKMWIAKGQMDDYERKSRKVKESVADPREYDLEDLGMTSEEADRARQEADDELTRLMDRMGVDANDAANHSRWNRVVDDIAYLVASCRRYDMEPYKYND